MLRRIAFRITHSLSFSIAVAAVYVGFVSFSPWVLIPYSDSMSLFVPVLCLYLYQKQQESSRKIPYWIGIGAVSAVGFLLKPQALVLSIAIVIWETLRLLSRNSVRAWSARIGSMVLVLLIGVGPLNGMLREYSLLGVDTTKSVGMMHYFMMGMNPETRGTYSGPDFMDTIYMPPEERSSIQLQKGVERIREMGFGGFMELMRDKILINYTDGMFGWGIYGTFFQEMIEDKDDVISPFLKSVVYSSGKHYPSFATGRQCIWVALLMGCLLLPFACCAIRGTERQGVLMIMMLAVMGLTAFECIFEALSRYLYAYTPVYLLMGMLGLWYALAWFGNRFRPEQTEA